jgi:outer membrane protein OmpA-like peptidoglycan-associated protein
MALLFGGASALAFAADKEPPKQFELRRTEEAPFAPVAPGKGKKSKLTSTATEAAMMLTVVDKDKGPVKGVVISLTAPDGKKYYTDETDAEGYAEVLVPVGQRYEVTYLSLGRKAIAASVNVTPEKKQNIKLTLRYKRQDPARRPEGDPPDVPVPPERFVLDGVNFDTAKATIRPESLPRLDTVIEFMAHKRGVRIEISGHTDNVGNAQANKLLSEKRAQAVREHLMSRGIDAARIRAVGFGDERPIAPNTTDEGRQRNRRIEAREL